MRIKTTLAIDWSDQLEVDVWCCVIFVDSDDKILDSKLYVLIFTCSRPVRDVERWQSEFVCIKPGYVIIILFQSA